MTLLISHVIIQSRQEQAHEIEEMTLDVAQQIDVKADIGDVFKAVLHRFGEGSTNPDGESMHMILEQWPGGRWFRNRGNGIGHLWGHVQVIKPPCCWN